jgi:hypothetical protein
VGASAREQQQNIQAVGDPFARNALRVAYHIRKYALLYVCGVAGAVALAIFPTVEGGPSGSLAAGGTGSGNVPSAATSGVSGGSAPAPAAGASGGTGAGSSAAPGGGGGTSLAGASASGTVPAGSVSSGSGGGSVATSPGSQTAASGGKPGAAKPGAPAGTHAVGSASTSSGSLTRGGYPCTSGARQLPFSPYAAPCVVKFTGNNGGATYNGVTASTITIAVRHTADSTGANALAAQAEGEAAGGDSYTDLRADMTKIVDYFNKTFEFYGRQIKLVDFNGQGNGTNEELGQDLAGACADADQAATTMHAFGDINYEGVFEYDPFSQCAARYHLYVPEGSAYFPESEYQALTPYVWGITMNCQLIAQEVAEFAGKQLAPYPAKWAGMDGLFNMQNTTRKFATYVPNNAGYQECVNETLSIDENQYHIPKGREDQYNYALDISTFPQDAQRAVVQFAADRDTTVTLACDPISPIFLTQDALNQNYHPEWLLIGVALTDSDNWAQLWDQSEITGHLFGLSQAGSAAVSLNPNGEAGTVFKQIGVPLDWSTATEYFELLSMANQIQMAGPDLTPANIAAGTARYPESGGPQGSVGTWHFGSSHTAIIDSREIYWDPNGMSPADGKKGTYVAIYGGNRYRLGDFPTGQPPMFG